MRNRLARIASLSAADWWLLQQAWTRLLLFDVALRVFPFPKVARWARGGGHSLQEPADAAGVIRAVQAVVAVAARHHLYPMRCLQQSLALQSLLARRGICAELRIGVAREGARIDAHAWLEHRGRAIAEPGHIAARFRPLEPRSAGG